MLYSFVFVVIGITGPPFQPNNITFPAFTVNVSIQLAWDTPSDTFNCVSFYLINTTSSEELLNTTNTSVLITRPAADPANTTYTVSVAAVDTFNRIGKWSDLLCFLFQGLSENFYGFSPIVIHQLTLLVPSLVISNTFHHDCSTNSFQLVWYVMVSEFVISFSVLLL